MSVIRGLFFDLDGTLVDTYEADFRAYRDAIEEVTGHKIGRDAFMATNGLEMRDKLKKLAPGLSEEKILAISRGKKNHYNKYLHLTTPNDQLIKFLAATAKSHCIALVTTAKRQNAMLVLEAHDIARHFSEMVFGDDISHPKPHPESYLLALEKTGLKPEEVIAFEDSDTGVQSAQAAGISVIQIRSFA